MSDGSTSTEANMRTRTKTGAILALGLLSTPAHAAQPVPVSPGHESKVATVESRCPTFSWTQTTGAKHYEIVIYQVERTAESTEVSRTRVFAGASTWTPSLDACLSRGGRYAWSVRANTADDDASQWSAPHLFQVADASNEVELEQAVATIRRYLELRDDSAKLLTEGLSAEPEKTDVASSSASPPAGVTPPGTRLSVDGNLDAVSFSGDGSLLTNLAPTSLSPGTAAIDISGSASNLTGIVSVENGGTGAIDAEGARANLGVPEGPHTIDTDTTCLDAGVDCHFAASDSESGAALSGDSATAFFSSGQIEEPRITDEIARDSEVIAMIAAIDRYCPGALGSGLRYSDCGNGAIRDNHTGLYWLKDASCADLAGTDVTGSAAWDSAESAAAALSDGTCGLTDGSAPGDWRQPTIDEFCTSWVSSMPCLSSAAPTSLVDSSVGPPTVINAAGTSVWSSGDPFVGVESSNYWSSTEVPGFPAFAWEALLVDGQIGNLNKADIFFIWPVRDQPTP